jgi:DNA modification methylase
VGTKSLLHLRGRPKDSLDQSRVLLSLRGDGNGRDSRSRASYCSKALAVLATLPADSVRCVVTSPPYWGLRDYGTATWSGGDPACLHRKSELRRGVNLAASTASTRGGAKKIAEVGWLQHGHRCPCGAVRLDEQLGLEGTPEAYLARLVAIFAEVRRVLQKDGTLWLNLGDSYAGSRAGSGDVNGDNPGNPHSRDVHESNRRDRSPVPRSDLRIDGLKPKDLLMMPARVAIALQASGWWLRSEIIWHKPNPMPESVTDRPTKAHEQIYLLAKAERYHYDADAIAEPVSENTHARMSQDVMSQEGSRRANGGSRAERPMKTVQKRPSGWQDAASREKGQGDLDGRFLRAPGVSPKSLLGKQGREKNNANFAACSMPVSQRNSRSVWTMPTQGYKGAHFATFPEELAARCIKAGTAPGDLVLDPFSGSGTTAAIAVGLGRRAIGIDLNPAYQELARHRIGPMLCEVLPLEAAPAHPKE